MLESIPQVIMSEEILRRITWLAGPWISLILNIIALVLSAVAAFVYIWDCCRNTWQLEDDIFKSCEEGIPLNNNQDKAGRKKESIFALD